MTTEVWAVWPSAKPKEAEANALRWKAARYKTAVLIDNRKYIPKNFDKVIVGYEWGGYPNAVNQLCKEVNADIIIDAADDIYPSTIPVEELAERFRKRFPDLFGIVQPTGDNYGEHGSCCQSPWIGRKYIREAYQGFGPYWLGYFHFFSDAELRDAAILLEAFDEWPDVVQYHDHWQRRKGEKRPPHLMEAKKQWKFDQSIYTKRKKLGFPGHERKVKCL